jgi:hypothetical protein
MSPSRPQSPHSKPPFVFGGSRPAADAKRQISPMKFDNKKAGKPETPTSIDFKSAANLRIKQEFELVYREYSKA